MPITNNAVIAPLDAWPSATPGKALPAEAELLCLCARTHGDATIDARIRELAATPLNWERFIEWSQSHGVLTLVAYRLLSVAVGTLPAGVANSLSQAQRASTFSNLSILRELLQLLDALDAARITVLNLKGPSLAQMAYGNVTLRPFGDLDILVDPGSVLAVMNVLEQFGYAVWKPTRPMVEHLAGEHEDTFEHPGGKSPIDLHWALSRGYLPFAVPFQTLHARARSLSVGGRQMLTLGNEDLFLFLCLHGAKHEWERLQWVCDVAELIRSEPTLDLKAALRRAAAVGNHRMVLVALELARSVSGAPLPQEIQDEIHADASALSITAFLRGRLLTPDTEAVPPMASLKRVKFHLSMFERRRDRLRYLLQAAVPNPRDRDAVVLPGPLRWAYFIVRPLRLIARNFSHAA